MKIGPRSGQPLPRTAVTKSSRKRPITRRDLFSKCVGWREFEFVFNDLSARDEDTELAIQVQLLAAGVYTVNEVRAMRGLGPIPNEGTGNREQGTGAVSDGALVVSHP